MDTCCVGRVATIYHDVLDHFDGRLAQVIEIFSESESRHKKAYNLSHKGVVGATLIDRYVPGDRLLNSLWMD